MFRYEIKMKDVDLILILFLLFRQETAYNDENSLEGTSSQYEVNNIWSQFLFSNKDLRENTRR